MALEMGVFALAAYFMGWIGAPAVAAHAVALQIAALTFMVPLGLGQAATVRVGLALGRRDEAGITRAGWTAWVIGVGFMGAMALVMWTIPRQLVTLFLADVPANAVVIALAVSFLRVAAAFQLVDGAQVIGAGMLRGLHDTRWPLIFALVGYWVVGLGIGSWLAFAADWKGVGIWVGLASGPRRGRGADAGALGDARPARPDPRPAPLHQKRLSGPLTDERRTTICAPSLALSWGECQRASSTLERRRGVQTYGFQAAS